MPLPPIKAGAALAFASFAVVVAPALAVSSLPLNEAPVFIPIQDEENKELWQDLRPDGTPPEAAVGTEGEGSKPVEKESHEESTPGDSDCVPTGTEQDSCGPGFHCQPGVRSGTGFCMRNAIDD